MIGMSGKERAMGIALSDLIETMGRAVQNANTAVEQAAAAAYLGQGYEMRDTGDGSKAYVPVCYTIQIPSAPDEKQIQVPVTALLHHTSLRLEQVDIKLKFRVEDCREGDMMVSVSASDNGAGSETLSDMALQFRNEPPAEGMARVNQHQTQIL